MGEHTKRLYFDLETEGLPADKLQPFLPDKWSTGNTKDPAKLAVAIEEKKADWMDKAALQAITGRIIAASTAKMDNEPEFHCVPDEQAIIQTVLDEMKAAIVLGGNIYSFNGNGFDLPFLCQRAAVYGIPAFQWLTTVKGGRRYFDSAFVDVMQVWNMSTQYKEGQSLKNVALALGCGVKDGNGKDFAALLKTDPIKAKEYALNDVILLRSVANKMGI